MKISIREIRGNWNSGYVLDKHTISSTYLGDDAHGHARFDTVRSEAGEALFQLKYRDDWTKVDVLANELAASIYPKFPNVGFLVPMPASNPRHRQPVTEVTKKLGELVDTPVFESILTKKSTGTQLKDLHNKDEKLKILKNTFNINDDIQGNGPWNVLLVDDLFDTGATLEAACEALRTYPKVRNIYVAVLTWK